MVSWRSLNTECAACASSPRKRVATIGDDGGGMQPKLNADRGEDVVDGSGDTAGLFVALPEGAAWIFEGSAMDSRSPYWFDDSTCR